MRTPWVKCSSAYFLPCVWNAIASIAYLVGMCSIPHTTCTAEFERQRIVVPGWIGQLVDCGPHVEHVKALRESDQCHCDRGICLQVNE